MSQPDAIQTVWYNTVGQCPRCAKPLNACGTPTFSRLHVLKCTGCGWSFDVETVRKSVLTQLTAVEPDEPEEPDGKDAKCDGNTDEDFSF